MKMNYWNWDVKDTLSGGSTMSDTIGTRSINLMAYLLHNLPYSTLYNDHIENVVHRLLINLDRFPNSLKVAADGSANDVGATLATELRTISLLLPSPCSGSPSGIKLRQYFEHQGAPHTSGVRFEIADVLRNLPRELNHFCMPFLPIYDDSTRRVPESRMDTYLRNLGAFTLFDIYTLSNSTGRYPAQKAEVKAAKSDRILTFTDRTSPDLALTTTDPENDLKCNVTGDDCDTSPGDWCNLDENGSCTIGS